jgi:hypothetical protein
VEWDHFVAEYPDTTASAADYVDRLVSALAPMFERADPPTDSVYARYARWLAPWVRRYRDVREREGMHAVQAKLSEIGAPLVAAVVITRELLGPDQLSLDAAQTLVTADPSWARLVEAYRRFPAALEKEFSPLLAPDTR